MVWARITEVKPAPKEAYVWKGIYNKLKLLET
ncbi:DUF3470 domain-containing protein [Pseudoalteromonas aliena]